MAAKDIIKKVIESGVLMEQLTTVPESGATAEDIAKEEERLARKLTLQHRELLNAWNGGNFEVIRLYGCLPNSEGLQTLAAMQELVGVELNEPICFADDPAGFSYLEDVNGFIYRNDHEYDKLEKVAEDINDFFGRFVFGISAAEFGGDDWVQELKEVGVL